MCTGELGGRILYARVHSLSDYLVYVRERLPMGRGVEVKNNRKLMPMHLSDSRIQAEPRIAAERRTNVSHVLTCPCLSTLVIVFYISVIAFNPPHTKKKEHK